MHLKGERWRDSFEGPVDFVNCGGDASFDGFYTISGSTISLTAAFYSSTIEIQSINEDELIFIATDFEYDENEPYQVRRVTCQKIVE